MLVDESILTRAGRQFDVVIVGAGAAGLTLAESLGRKLSILVVEAGEAKETRRSEDDCRGEVVEGSFHPPPNLYRVRALGGASRIWGGRCIPYDPIDFERRDWVAHSGWPISYEEVARYYPAALTAAEAGSAFFDPATALVGEQRELVPGLDGPSIRTTIERFSRPTNFWTRFRSALAESQNIHVLPSTPVTKIELKANARSVASLEVQAPSGRRWRIKAKAYVLAGGGLETTRLLLASNDVARGGVGNADDQVGRYYMSHLCTTASVAAFKAQKSGIAFNYSRDPEGIYVRRRLWITADAQRRHRLLNVTFRTHLPDPGDPAHKTAILSAMFLAKGMVQREYAAKMSESAITAADYGRHLLNVVRQPFALTRFANMWVRDRVLAARKLPSVVLPSHENKYMMEFHSEQAPNRESRVALSDAKDRYDIPRLRIDWRVSALDTDSLARAHRLLAQELERTGTGSLIYDPASLPERAARFGIVGGHHIGTTRMSETARTGVVDTDCRVHGVGNLFVASASVLPTSGQANPTLTILALALRLSEHLKRVLDQPSTASSIRAAEKSPLHVD